MEKEEKKPGAEKFWKQLIDVYFTFYRTHFVDKDGYQLSPDWSESKRGMEYSGLKKIITRLRTISEEKKIEWDEQQAKADLWNFLLKAYHNFAFIRNGFMCCLMAKYKDMIIVSTLNFTLSKKICELWYQTFPEKKDEQRDLKASEIIIGYLKQQYLQKNLLFSDSSVVSSVRLIFNHVKNDEFWSVKSLISVAYNIGEFVIKIKSKQNEKKYGFSREGINEEFNRRYGNGK